MRSCIRAAAGVVLTLGFARPLVAQEAKSIVTDLMAKGKSAFFDLKYKQADSLARRVLGYSMLLTPQQKIDAIQLVVAASYPEDESEHKADVAIDHINQLLTLGSKTGIPKDLSWPGLDSLYAWVQRAATGTVAPGAATTAAAPPAAPVSTAPGQVRLGSPTPEAFLYVNDRVVGPISTANYWNVPGGEPVKLSIRSVKCTIPWDTTLTVASGTQVTIGRRLPGGCT